jgi:hypothetical protein
METPSILPELKDLNLEAGFEHVTEAQSEKAVLLQLDMDIDRSMPEGRDLEKYVFTDNFLDNVRELIYIMY